QLFQRAESQILPSSPRATKNRWRLTGEGRGVEDPQTWGSRRRLCSSATCQDYVSRTPRRTVSVRWLRPGHDVQAELPADLVRFARGFCGRVTRDFTHQAKLSDAGEVQERLVDRVDFDVGGELLQRLHDAAAHVAVEGVIGREYGDAVLGGQGADLEIRIAHPEAEGLGFVGAGDHAAVVVGQDDHRPVVDGGVEDPLAGRVENVAIDQGEHARSVFPHAAGDASPDLEVAALGDLERRVAVVLRHQEDAAALL